MSLVHFKLNELARTAMERSAKIQIFIFQKRNFKISCFKKFTSQRTDLHTFIVPRNLYYSRNRASMSDDMTFIISPDLNIAFINILSISFFFYKKKKVIQIRLALKMLLFFSYFLEIDIARLSRTKLSISKARKKSQAEPISQLLQFLIACIREIRRLVAIGESGIKSKVEIRPNISRVYPVLLLH